MQYWGKKPPEKRWKKYLKDLSYVKNTIIGVFITYNITQKIAQEN